MAIGFRGTAAASVVIMAVTLMAGVVAQAGQAARAPQPGNDQGAARDAASGRLSYTQTGCDTCHGTDAAAPPQRRGLRQARSNSRRSSRMSGSRQERCRPGAPRRYRIGT
jgi:cytochrome c553